MTTIPEHHLSWFINYTEYSCSFIRMISSLTLENKWSGIIEGDVNVNGVRMSIS